MNSILHNCQHGGKFSTKWPNQVKIDFSSNINPLGISKKVLTLLRKNIKLAYEYPDPNSIELKKSIINYLESKMDDINCIIIGNGATELIHYFASAFVKKKVLIPSPTFCEYELASRRYNANIIYCPLKKNFQLDSEEIVKIANDPTNDITTIFLCNPNNPTGKYSKSKITEILEKTDNKKLTILIDESYIEFINENNSKSKDEIYFINLCKDYKNLIILRSLTKTFGLAGLRVGYAVSNEKIIEKLNTRLISWNVNGLAQLAAIESLKDKDHLIASKKNNKFEKKRIFKSLSNNKEVKGISTDANFYLIKILNEKNSTQVANDLLIRMKLLVRDCKSFVGMNDKFLRVSIKTPKENNYLLNGLKKTT